MENTIYGYESVFNRDSAKEFEFLDFLNNPEIIFEAFDKGDFETELKSIKNIADKQERNNAKRDYLPAVDISNANILSIDIDGIFHDEVKKAKVIELLKKTDSTYAIKESVSGNIVAFFKYKCESDKYKFLYYKLYLQLVLKLSISIDFLPEIGRLRYVSIGETYYLNEDSEVITDFLEVDELPYINTVVKQDNARRVIYGSR